MRTTALCAVLAAAAAGGAAAAADADGGVAPCRPTIDPQPYQPRLPVPAPAARGKRCTVRTCSDGASDDSAFVLAALRECNDGGHVVFSKDVTYIIGTAMDWTFLKSIDIEIQGTIKFTNDTDYWQKAGFDFVFQNVTTFFKLGGDDVFIYGGGTLDGSGQVWYDLFATTELIRRPVLIGIDGLTNSILSDLVLRYSPQYYVFIANSTNVVFNNFDISGFSSSANTAKNTDGWDTYRSSDISIMNSVINNGDDCVSFKPNSTSILVQKLWCNGSHGISVGSLGQYQGEYDIVRDVYVADVSMHNASDGARIKVWPDDPDSAVSSSLQGGGGSGEVRNITFDGMVVDSVDYAVEITQCYGRKNLTQCLLYPSRLTITDVVIKNLTGTTSAKHSPDIGTFTCSSADVCKNIIASDVNVVSPAGTNEAFCLNMDKSKLDVTCTDKQAGTK